VSYGPGNTVNFKQLMLNHILLLAALQCCEGFSECDFYYNINFLLLFVLSAYFCVIQHVSSNKRIILR